MNQITVGEPAVELPRHIVQKPSINRIIEIYPTNGLLPAPRARIAIAQSQFKNCSYQSRSSSCRYLLQRLLCSISMDQNQHWQLKYSDSGAPRLAAYEEGNLHISMAYSANWLAAGVARGARIGVDIERIKPRKNISEKADFLDWKVPVHDLQDFYAKWTLWEASAKCAEGSALMRKNPGFEMLCHMDLNDRVGKAVPWGGLQGCYKEEVIYAVVLQCQTDASLGHRTLHPEKMEPWRDSIYFKRRLQR